MISMDKTPARLKKNWAENFTMFSYKVFLVSCMATKASCSVLGTLKILSGLNNTILEKTLFVNVYQKQKQNIVLGHLEINR
jgi:hypothetical protein